MYLLQHLDLAIHVNQIHVEGMQHVVLKMARESVNAYLNIM